MSRSTAARRCRSSPVLSRAAASPVEVKASVLIKHTICESQVDPLTAQAHAEMAQQQLFSTGLIAQAAAVDAFFKDMLETYSTVQQLYHKALRPLLERHSAYVDSPASEFQPLSFDAAFALVLVVVRTFNRLQPGNVKHHCGDLQQLQDPHSLHF